MGLGGSSLKTGGDDTLAHVGCLNRPIEFPQTVVGFFAALHPWCFRRVQGPWRFPMEGIFPNLLLWFRRAHSYIGEQSNYHQTGRFSIY